MKHLLILLTTVVLFGCGNQNNVKMEQTANKQVGTIELVIFKTKPGFTEDEVIEAARAVNPVVKQFKGYISRRLARDTDGTWTDMVYWTDEASATHAAREVMKSDICQKFFGMIDEQSMVFRHLQPVMDDDPR